MLAINGGKPVIDPAEAKFIWPRITAEAEMAILEQLQTNISIYDRSGIIKKFEDAFSKYHAREYGLLSNSGTSAIFAMYESINLQPGDEVLCPVYTFHATVSPITYTGATPIFCDSDEEGNISLDEIKKRTTPNTKAIIVTHMWGVPVKDIEEIANYCKQNGLALLEDCSHAHGASINNKKVGSFGSAAAWSLQGQKIITGGEGGIMLTDDREHYYRALLQGHYNKRPKQEIPPEHPQREYYLTGMGLKLRSHPLAVALAMQQFDQLDIFVRNKQKYANKFARALEGLDFLSVPNIKTNTQNSWYAFNLRFNKDKARGINREEFVAALHAEGLVEADIPGSTGLLNELPLFTNPQKLMPRLYKTPSPRQSGYPNAQEFYDSIIKFPMWTFDDEAHVVDSYIEGILKVANYVTLHGILGGK